jgi:hypothetical protein
VRGNLSPFVGRRPASPNLHHRNGGDREGEH